MKFLLDHDIPAQIAQLLRYWKHNVTVLHVALPVPASDEEVFGHACSQEMIFISCNRDHEVTDGLRNEVTDPVNPRRKSHRTGF